MVSSCSGKSPRLTAMMLTFRHVESWKIELTITNSTLAVSCLAHHRCNEITDKLDVGNKLFCGNTSCECPEGFAGWLQYNLAIIIETLYTIDGKKRWEHAVVKWHWLPCLMNLHATNHGEWLATVRNNQRSVSLFEKKRKMQMSETQTHLMCYRSNDRNYGMFVRQKSHM